MSSAPVSALRPGAHVRIIAPASPFPEDDFANGLTKLRERYRVTLGRSVHERDGYLAGPDDARLADLEDALTDRDVDAIVAARGGYGVTRLLPRLGVEQVRAHPKLLVGFSDVTALHALWARAGLRSLHASMVAGLGRADAVSVARWFEACEGEALAPFEGLEAIGAGVAEGPVVGGNLALVCALQGTPYALRWDDAIVVLEDVGEAPYRVDRMLTQLRQAGLERAAGVVLGEFTGCATRPDGREVSHVLHERLEGLAIPVARGLSIGHGKKNRPLPLGARARLDADAGQLAMLESAVTKP